MIIPEKIVCDICGSEIKVHRNFTLPVRTNCDWTEGKFTLLRLEIEKFDICENCLFKVTNVYCDFQGSNPRFLNNNEVSK